MTGYFVDWSAEYDEEIEEGDWEFVSRDAMLEKYGEYSEDNEDGLEGGEDFPVFDWVYPLTVFGEISKEKLIRVHEETVCTVVYNVPSGEYCLALCACGANYSQDIALAYMIMYARYDEDYGNIDWSYLDSVSIRHRLSITEEKYQILLRTLNHQLTARRGEDRRRIDKISVQIKQAA